MGLVSFQGEGGCRVKAGVAPEAQNAEVAAYVGEERVVVAVTVGQLAAHATPHPPGCTGAGPAGLLQV